VVGFDIDDALLDIARRKREGAGLTDAQLTLICADALKFDLQEEFDWAFLIFNTLLNFTTADSQDALLANTVRHLKPGGKLWIDIFNPDLSILSIPYAPHFDSASFYVPSLDRCVHRVTSLRQSEKVPQLQHMAFQYTWADAAGELQTKSVQFDMTWMFPRELTRLLERHGLRVDQVYGDYDGSDVTPASPRLIALATKLK
jgi:SAM-dependent methyltransferase